MKGKFHAFRLCLLALGILGNLYCLYGQESNKKDWTKTFQVDKKDFVSVGDNPYFILRPGYKLALKGKEDGKNVTLFITVLDETKLVYGVETRVVEEKEYKSGQLVEVSRNYFALDKMDTSIYYFGEEVDIYKKGKIVGHEGAWQSGKNGAQFGLMMPGNPSLGSRYYQEIAPDVAMDRAEIISTNDTLKTPGGFFEHCLKTEETTALKPGEKEYKVYALGIGLIKDASLLLVEYGSTAPAATK